MKNLLFVCIATMCLLISAKGSSATKPIVDFTNVNSSPNNKTNTGDENEPKRTSSKKTVAQSTVVSILPNASRTGSIQVKLSMAKEQQATVTVYDYVGTCVATQLVKLTLGSNNIAVDNITALTSGTYDVIIQGTSVKLTSKLMIW